MSDNHGDKISEQPVEPLQQDFDPLGDSDAMFDLALDLEASERQVRPRKIVVPPKRRVTRRRDGVFVIPAKSAAVGAVVVGIGSLTALVLVANAKSAEALATIALALAILAFVVQILVFVAQAQAAGQQMLQSEQLNTQTRALLSEMQTSTRATERMVGEQFGDLLKAFVESNEGGKLDMDTFERHLIETFERRIATRDAISQSQQEAEQSSARIGVGSRAASRAAVERQRRMQQVRMLRTFPTESEGGTVLGKVKGLDLSARDRLHAYLDDEVRVAQQGGYVGLELEEGAESADQALIEQGLLGKARVTSGGSPIMIGRLTDEGRIAARILGATGDVPTWLAPEIPLPRTPE